MGDRRQKILIYSDCFIFGGSENIIPNLLNDDKINERYDLVFCYAYSKQYDHVAKQRIPRDANAYSVKIHSALNLWEHKIHHIKERGDIVPVNIKLKFALHKIVEHLGLYSIINLFRLYKVFLKEKPVIILINNGGYPGAPSCRVAVIAAAMSKVESVIFIVNNMAVPVKNFIEKAFDKLINKYVRTFVTASKAAGICLIKERHFQTDKLVNIPNTLSIAMEKKITTIHRGELLRNFPVANGKRIIGAVGLLTERKGFHLLIDAMSLLAPELRDSCVLFIFGEGEDKSLLQKKILDYGLSDTIILPGFRSNIEEYVADFDFFVSSSISHEDFPYSIVEAMALSKPVIGTRVAGIPEQISEGQTGWIVEPGNVNQLASAISNALMNIALLPRMGSMGKEKYDRLYSNTVIIGKYFHLFTKLSLICL